MVKVGLKYYKMIKKIPKWSNIVKYDLIWSYMVHMSSLKSSKWVQHNQVSWSCFKCHSDSRKPKKKKILTKNDTLLLKPTPHNGVQ